MTIKIDDEVLILAAAFDRAADPLSRMVAGGDADLFAGWVRDRFDLAGLVQLEQIAVRSTGSHPASGTDASGGDFDQIDRIGGPTDSNDRPLSASLVGIFSPQDLG